MMIVSDAGVQPPHAYIAATKYKALVDVFRSSMSLRFLLLFFFSRPFSSSGRTLMGPSGNLLSSANASIRFVLGILVTAARRQMARKFLMQSPVL